VKPTGSHGRLHFVKKLPTIATAAVSAAATTAAIVSTAAAAAATTAAIVILRLGLVYFQSAAINFLAVESRDSFLSFRRRGHFNKAESA
jgi:hypothetical protein